MPDLPVDMVLVQNEVGLGVVADNPLARQYVDLSGKAAQLLAAQCDQLFFCCAGLSLQLKLMIVMIKNPMNLLDFI